MRRLSIIALLLASLPLSATLAQDTNVDSAEQTDEATARDTQARRLYGLGSDAFEAERFSEAAVYFLEAYGVTPLPDLLFNAGAAHQRAEEDQQAIGVFERYLQNHQGDTHEAEIDARLLVLRRRVRVNETEHGGDTATTRTEQSSALPLALVIGGAVTAAAGATFLILAGGARSTVEDGSGFYSSVEADADRASTFGVVGGVALGVGVALAAVGVVLWVTGGENEDEDEDEERSSTLRVGLNGAEWTTSW